MSDQPATPNDESQPAQGDSPAPSTGFGAPPAQTPGWPSPQDAGWAAMPPAGAAPQPGAAPSWQPGAAPTWPSTPDAEAAPGWAPQGQPQGQPQGWPAQGGQPDGTPGWAPQAPGAPEWGVNPYGAPLMAAPASNRPKIFLVIGVGILAVALIAGVGLVVASRNNSNGITVSASQSVSADKGTTIFSDDFHDPSSGWTTETLASGTTYSYGANGYVIVAKGDLVHFAYSPYDTGRQQLSMSTTATLTGDTPNGAGFGVSCARGTGSSSLSYEFMVYSDGGWTIDRRDGVQDVNSEPTTVAQGSGADEAGLTPVTVVGTCATTDSQTTRLILYVDGKKVHDGTDTANSLSPDSWVGGLNVYSTGQGVQTFTVTKFEERDLSH